MSRTAKEIETTGLPCEAQNGETIQVVPKIDVTMFGKFTLKQEGMEVPHAVSLTGRSRRLWTLTAYLILNRNRGVSAQELIDLLWPEAENDNPLSTLQNNVIRGRVSSGTFPEETLFRSLSRLILLLEEQLDTGGAPKASPIKCTETPTFELDILFRQNYSWQGRLRWTKGGKEAAFRSVLELLIQMETVLAQ